MSEDERKAHPERFAPRNAPPGFGGYSVAYIAQVARQARAESEAYQKRKADEAAKKAKGDAC